MTRKSSRPSIETLAVHGARPADEGTGAVTPAINLSTTFVRDPDGGYPRGFNYTRDDNPNRGALEHGLALLEEAGHAVAFSSGSAATLCVFQAAAALGDIVATDAAYHGTLRQLREIAPRFGARVRFVDTTSLDAVRESLAQPAALLFIETPSNPLLDISDIAALAEIAASRGATLACDNTFATPVLQNPLTLGADLVIHSATKYLGGHSDLLSGAVAGNAPEWMEPIRDLRGATGAAPSPFDCWLLQRSLPTLPLRVRAQSEAAMQIATSLIGHPALEAVLYPGLPGHPGHEIARRQMRGFGGMLSIQVRGDADTAMAVAARTRLFTRATSLGGVESLIEHRASIEGPGTRTPANLLRLSVGLEHPDELIDDLRSALEAVRAG
ncbi:MAG: aminotransferase class I/II-fold pyridoxal phosphate-dependent enzyme [Gammaproteobacteria bacterium]